MKLGLAFQAIKDLEDAIAEAPTGARLFHLAQAQLLAKNKVAAVAALQKAKNLGFKPENLHPLERPRYQELVAALEAT
jgi:hypothetical protein